MKVISLYSCRIIEKYRIHKENRRGQYRSLILLRCWDNLNLPELCVTLWFSFYFSDLDLSLSQPRYSWMAQRVKNLPEMQERQELQVWSLGPEDPLEKEMATHSSILAWEIPWTEEACSLQSKGWQRIKHDWQTKHIHCTKYFRRLLKSH